MWKWLHYGVVGLLCLLSVVCGVLSLSKLDVTFLRYPLKAARTQLLEYSGELLISARDHQLVVHWEGEDFSQRATALKREYGIPGVSFTREEFDMSPHTAHEFIAIFYRLLIAFWFLSLVFAVYPAIFFIRSYRRRRLRRQALKPCGQCGYDLHGNESGTCPECGRTVESTV